MGVYSLDVPARYRLRFLLQEFDLGAEETLVGRSLDCHVTIEDPLVSRKHARFAIAAGGVTIEDLGSRNGVRVNGERISAPRLLSDGDRIRVGTQELVFCMVDTERVTTARVTGSLRLCEKCRLPFPREVPACPSCEWSEEEEDGPETSRATVTDEVAGSGWNTMLLIQGLRRAMDLKTELDVHRMLERVVFHVEHMRRNGELTVGHWDELSHLCARAVLEFRGPNLSRWIRDVYADLERPVASSLELDLRALEGAGDPLSETVEGVRALPRVGNS